MAQRTWTTIDDFRSVADDLRRQVRLHVPPIDRDRLPLLLWQVATAPIWFGSDMPTPALPGRRASSSRRNPSPAGDWLELELTTLVQRFWRSWWIASLLRGTAIGVAVSALWTLVALTRAIDLPHPAVLTGCPLAGMIAGLAFGIVNRPDTAAVAAMLDRTFHLDERLTTAVDALGAGHRGDYVARLQLADAANALRDVSTDLPRPIFAPLRELLLLIVALTALFTALFAWVPRDDRPMVNPAAVPAFVPASERLTAQTETSQPLPATSDVPTVAEVQARSEASTSAREDIGRVGEALAQHPATQAAADAIASGDYERAADLLTQAAADAESMSPEARNALADELDAAADDISGENPELAQSAREAANDLREGGPTAGDGLGGLADDIEDAGEQVVPQDELAEDLREAQTNDSSGGSSSASEPGAGSQQQEGASGAGGSESGGEAGPLGDPGEGVAAEPGVVQDGAAEPASGQSQSGSGGAQSEAGAEQSGSGSQPQEGGGTSGGDAESGAPADGSSSSSSSADSQGLIGNPDDETNASQGSGAGTGQSNANDAPRGDQDVEAPAPAEDERSDDVPGQGEAADDPPQGSDPNAGAGTDGGTVRGGEGTLPLQGTSDEGVQTGGDSGSSSTGGGSGAGTASGDAAQGDVGVAGPDSNVVPDDVRDTVGDYFDGEGTAP